jgi:hypothetical protein
MTGPMRYRPHLSEDDPERVERNLIRPASKSERMATPAYRLGAFQGGRARTTLDRVW